MSLSDREPPTTEQDHAYTAALDGTLVVEGVLSPDEVEELVADLCSAPLADGASSAGSWAASAKRNKHAVPGAVEQLSAFVASRLLPKLTTVYPHRLSAPIFNRYDVGDYYHYHEDNPIQAGIRADLSFTLFLSNPSEYEGGELILGLGSERRFRLDAGSIVIYDCGTPHQVARVTRGTRLAAIGWIQSAIRSSQRRRMLQEFSAALTQLDAAVGPLHPAFLALNRIRNQLFRSWVEF